MIVKAYAKLNLVLNVFEKKEGQEYHEIESLMIPVSLHDSIEVSKLSEGINTYVTCDSFELSGERFNIVTKTIKLLREKYNFKEQFRVVIYKRIFIAGGLGGGSSDAAAVILAINKILKLKMTDEEMIDIAKQVGSDVPFFLFNKPAIISGYGEKIKFLEGFSKKYNVLLLKPKKGLSTAEVYKKYDDMGSKSARTNIEKVIEAFNDNEFTLGSEISNDLETPAFEMLPEVKELKTKLITEEGYGCVMMTGSGSTVFIISTDKKALYKTYEKYYESDYSIEICKTL